MVLTTSPTAPRRRRRVVVVAVAVAFAVALGSAAVVIRVTTALLAARTTSTTSGLAAGTVSLGQTTSSACTATGLLPGSAPATCTLTTTYTGTENAYLGLDVLIATQPGLGGTPLYNPGDPGRGLQVSITSAAPATTYRVPVLTTTCPAAVVAGSTCYELDGELVSATALTSGASPTTFTTIVSLPAASTTGYRGGSAQVVLTAHAVQAAGNSVSGCTAGTACSSIVWN